MLVGSETEVLDSLSGILGSSEKKSVASGRSAKSQLIKSQGLTSSSKNASASGGSESESRNAELGDCEETVVISDGADDDDGLALLLGTVLDDSGDGDGGSVDAGHEETAENDLVEGGVGSACWHC